MAGTEITVHVDRKTVEELQRRVERLERLVDTLLQREIPATGQNAYRIEIDPRRVEKL